MIKVMIFLQFFFSDLKLGIFHRKLGKKDTFWHWEYNPITAIKSAKNKLCMSAPLVADKEDLT